MTFLEGDSESEAVRKSLAMEGGEAEPQGSGGQLCGLWGRPRAHPASHWAFLPTTFLRY